MTKKPIDITPQESVVPVFLVELTESEIAAQEAEQQAIMNARESARLEREAKLESALNKLKSLGLTESEAKIIIGLE